MVRWYRALRVYHRRSQGHDKPTQTNSTPRPAVLGAAVAEVQVGVVLGLDLLHDALVGVDVHALLRVPYSAALSLRSPLASKPGASLCGASQGSSSLRASGSGTSSSLSHNTSIALSGPIVASNFDVSFRGVRGTLGMMLMLDRVRWGSLKYLQQR